MKRAISLAFLLVLGVTHASQVVRAQSEGWTSATDTYDYRTVTLEYPERFTYTAETVQHDDRLTHALSRSIILSNGEKRISIAYSDEIGIQYVLRNARAGALEDAARMTYGENEGRLILNPFPPMSAVVRIFAFDKADYSFIITDIGSGLSQAEWDRLLSSIKVDVADIAPVPPPYAKLGAYRGLCKTQSSSTVYNCSLMDGGVRQPFTDEQIFKAWGFDFKDVQIISEERMANQDLGSPVLPPRGSWIKIQSKPETYEVQRDGKTLRWIADEDTAFAMRGKTWNQNIYTVDVTLWQQFQIGEPIKVKVEAL